MNNHPIKLEKEPLIDALFELRFKCSRFPASTVIPGVLFNKLNGEKQIEHLHTFQIPSEIRNLDPNLQFAPVSRLSWSDFYINIGDRSLSVSCKIPCYPGWNKFKKAIETIIQVMIDENLIDSVERYSIKYVNLIPSNDIEEQVSLVNFNASVAGHNLSKEDFQFRIEICENNLVNVISLVSSAEIVTQDSTIKNGLIVDIDTIALVENESLDNVLDKLEQIKQANRKIFFECLTEKSLKLLGAIYVQN